MQRGEKIFCESNALVMKEQNLTVSGRMRGGLFQSFMRKFTTGESLFQQEIEAANGAGECLLSPNLDGDMQILDVGPQQYTLSDGAFVAATEHTNIKAKVQTNLGGAIFGGKNCLYGINTSFLLANAYQGSGENADHLPEKAVAGETKRPLICRTKRREATDLG